MISCRRSRPRSSSRRRINCPWRGETRFPALLLPKRPDRTERRRRIDAFPCTHSGALRSRVAAVRADRAGGVRPHDGNTNERWPAGPDRRGAIQTKYENWRDTRTEQKDKRTAFIASVYLGEVIDTFAADEVLKYLNPEDANERRFRTVGGVDFQYRLTGKADSGRQLWVFGETVHGVRSRDVDCKKENNQKLTVCQGRWAGANRSE